MAKQRATELQWLRYFYENADFGPAYRDVIDSIAEDFTKETGMLLPLFYDWIQAYDWTKDEEDD